MHDYFDQKVIMVTGAAGFIASHLVDRLLDLGAQVVGVDNFITGNRENLAQAMAHERFTFIEADISFPVEQYYSGHVNAIFHLASPASPPVYQQFPMETYRANAFGTHYLLWYAKIHEARFLLASTSEVYGDPLVHPQTEGYWGNVNPVGVRSCYDESKRFGEMVTATFRRKYGLNTRIVRIFNTYGPRMNPEDGRIIPTFISQALKNEPISVHGDGSQTRSFCYVDDLVEFLLRMMAANETEGEIVNIGNPTERTVKEMAETIKEITGSASEIEYHPRPEDDPEKRKPDIAKAKSLLSYEPQVGLEEGLRKTVEYFRQRG